MKHLFFAGLMVISVALGSTPAHADCGIESGSIRILANDFPASGPLRVSPPNAKATLSSSFSTTRPSIPISPSPR